MKKSRLFALLLALTMVVSLFAGCGGDTDKPANDTPAADTPGTTTPLSLPPQSPWLPKRFIAPTWLLTMPC